MAYPTVSAPYGLKPVNLIGGRVFAGSTRMFPITNGYSTSLFNGDVVQLGASGATQGTLIASTLNPTTGTATGGSIGIFVGCEYSTTGGPIYGKNRYQYWNASTSAPDAIGYVVDDPQAVFQTVVLANGTSNSSTIQYINPAFIGSNAYYLGALNSNTGSTTTGDSAAGIAIATTAIGTGVLSPNVAAAPFRIVQLVTASAVTVTGNGTTSSTTLTLSATNSAIQPGMAVSGPGINAGSNTWVTQVNGTAVTLSAAVTTAQSTAAQFSFTGYPEALVTWNFGYQSYMNATGI